MTREDALAAALIEARKVLIVACGTEAPYIRMALAGIDQALAIPATVETEWQRETLEAAAKAAGDAYLDSVFQTDHKPKNNAEVAELMVKAIRALARRPGKR